MCRFELWYTDGLADRIEKLVYAHFCKKRVYKRITICWCQVLNNFFLIFGEKSWGGAIQSSLQHFSKITKDLFSLKRNKRYNIFISYGETKRQTTFVCFRKILPNSYTADAENVRPFFSRQILRCKHFIFLAESVFILELYFTLKL